jgi:dienelactone hydrolase
MTARVPALTTLALLLAGCAAHGPVRPTPAVAGAEHVQFPSRDREEGAGAPTRLSGWLFRPPGPGPFPAVVALHGCGGLYARRGDLSGRHRDWAERLVRSGHVVLFPDSFGARGLDEVCTRRDRPVRPGRERSADAYGALAYLQSLSFVRADRVALLGWSNGGATVLATIGGDAPARRAGAGDFRVAIAFYPGCNAALRDAAWLPLAAPLHILIGGADDWTPAAACRALADRAAAAGAPLALTVYDGAYHDFDAPNLAVHVRRDVATTASGTATLGTNEPARAAAIARVEAILRSALW